MGIKQYVNPTHPSAGLSLADALFTSTQQKVLSILFGQPGRSFYASELIALAKAGSGAVQRELKRLSESGLVTVRKIGNQKHFQANAESPIFREVMQIVRKTFGLAQPISEALQKIADRIDLAFIYGSVAKNKDGVASDLDLLVVSDSLDLEGLYASLLPVENEVRREINPILFTPEEFRQRRKEPDSFLSRILDGEIVELIGSAGEY